MKLNQLITRVGPGEFEAVVSVMDDAGNEKEMNRTYQKTNSIYPAYKSFISAIQSYEDVEIEVTTNHNVFADELETVYELNTALARILADLLERRNIKIKRG